MDKICALDGCNNIVNGIATKIYCHRRCAKRAEYLRNKDTYVQYEKDNRTKRNAYWNTYYHKNKESVNNRRKELYKFNSDIIKIRVKKYRLSNLDKVKKSKKVWAEKYKSTRNLKHRERYKTDTLYRLRFNMRTRLRKFLRSKGWSKNCETSILIGCTYEDLKLHIESKFDNNMSWDNYGVYWHIDHKIPLNSAKSVKELNCLCHYSNLQPLEAIENLKKGDKII